VGVGTKTRIMARYGHSDDDYLFWKHDFHAVLEHQRDRLNKAINAASPESIRNGSLDDVAARFADQFRLDVPELTEGAISATVDETQVDVGRDSQWAFQYGSFGRGPASAPGIQATYYVPFTGDGDLFKCKPSTYSSVIPAAEVKATELEFRFVQPGEDVAATKTAFDRELGIAKQYLGWLARDAQGFNESLLGVARGFV
jgi:hypothetical protein